MITSAPWPRRTPSFVLLAVLVAVVIAWAVRDWAIYLDARPVPHLPTPSDRGHHGESSVPAPPPAILREHVANFAGITLLAAHPMFAGVLAAAAMTRRWARARPVVGSVIFAGISALLAALATLPVAELTVGDAIPFGNVLAAAITVAQHSFVLILVVVVLFDLGPLTRHPGKGDPRAQSKGRPEGLFGRWGGTGTAGRQVDLRALR